MILSVFLIFVLILLSSSFVLRYIYRGASNVTITQTGLLDVYKAAAGDEPFVYSDDDEDYYDDYDYDYEYEYNYDDQDLYFTDGTGIYTQD